MVGGPLPERPVPAPARLGGTCGVAAVVGGLSGVLAATAVAPWFSWTGNALSDLGAPGRETALLFNGSIIAAGLLYLVFVWGLWKAGAVTALPGRASLAMLAGGALFLVGVGLVPEGNSLHFPLSVGYFFLYPPGVLLYGAVERRQHQGLLAASAAMAMLALAFGVLQFTPVFTSQAIPEIVLSTSLGVWSALVGLWLRRGEIPPQAVRAAAP